MIEELKALITEMWSEVKGNTMPIVHDAATFHWAEKLETLLPKIELWQRKWFTKGLREGVRQMKVLDRSKAK